MKPSKEPVALFLVPLLVLSLACSALPSLGGTGGGSSDITVPDGATVLFSDDFSDTGSGWDRVNTAEGVTDYADGGYRIYVNQANHDYWANPSQSFTDVRVEVDATKVGGPDDNDFGVICRYQDTQNFYAFLISSDGYYGVLRVVDGSSGTIGSDGMEQSDAILQGASTNKVRADCVGSELTLYVNGRQVTSVNDSTFSSGDVGLMAGTFEQVGTDILFDNFLVLQP